MPENHKITHEGDEQMERHPEGKLVSPEEIDLFLFELEEERARWKGLREEARKSELPVWEARYGDIYNTLTWAVTQVREHLSPNR